MARFTKAVDIWKLSREERENLQPGQWVYAGDESAKGIFFGEGSSTVVAWLGNARGHSNYREYISALRAYGKQVTANRLRCQTSARFTRHFDSFVCAGDRIECEVNGVRYVATLEHDTDTHVDDHECYSEKQIQSWRNDEWHFFGVVISAYIDEDCVMEHAASLWGIEGNFPSRRKNPNTYFRDVANELLDEAIEAAEDAVERKLEKLQKVNETIQNAINATA